MSKKKKKKTEIKGGEISHEETSSRWQCIYQWMSRYIGHQRKWEGPSVLNKAQCPQVILKAHAIGFLYSIRALQLTHPLSHSPGAGDSKRQPFDMKITQGSIFQGHNEIRPTHSTQGEWGELRAREWNQSLGSQFPGGRGWLFIQPALLISRAVHSLNLTPDRPKSLHWSKKFSTGQPPIYILSLSLATSPGRPRVNRAPLATESLKAASMASDVGRSNANSGVFNPIPECFQAVS